MGDIVTVLAPESKIKTGLYLGNYSNCRKAMIFWDDADGHVETVYPQKIISKSSKIRGGVNKEKVKIILRFFPVKFKFHRDKILVKNY